MAKVNLDDLRLGISSIQEHAMVGVLSKDGKTWLHKTDIHDDFVHAVVAKWEGNPEEVTGPTGTFKISVNKIEKEETAHESGFVKEKNIDNAVNKILPFLDGFSLSNVEDVCRKLINVIGLLPVKTSNDVKSGNNE